MSSCVHETDANVFLSVIIMKVQLLFFTFLWTSSDHYNARADGVRQEKHDIEENIAVGKILGRLFLDFHNDQ